MPDRRGLPAREDIDWRANAKALQRQALPSGPTVVSSTGPYGVGGLGQHLADLVEALRDAGKLASYLTPKPAAHDTEQCGLKVPEFKLGRLATRLPPIRSSPGLRILVRNVAFDYAAARRLSTEAKHLLIFNGQALRHIDVARRLGYESVGLVSANAHLAHEAREFERAWRQYPIERPWAQQNVRRNLAEYRNADYIHVSSEYVWNSFVDEGISQDRLRLFPLVPSERFQLRTQQPTVPTFNVVYIGSLAVHKGVPLLIDAIHALPYDDLRLVLVGSWGTRRMRRHIEAACSRDSRIVVCPGDPLPHLLQAGVCVHPSFGEGCSYAPGEALATGVPLIVSSNTGMNLAIGNQQLRHVFPTGNLSALRQAIEAAYRGEL